MFNFRTEKRTDFEHVAQPEDCEHLLQDSERSSTDSAPLKRVAKGPSWTTTTIAVIATAIISTLFGALVAQYDRLNADAFSIRHTQRYCKLKSDGRKNVRTNIRP